MKRTFFCLLLAAFMMIGGSAAARGPAYSDVPPEPMETQAEGALDSYDLTFPDDMPLQARNFVLLARSEFEKHGGSKLPKSNEYSLWFYGDDREIGWCSVFQLYCAQHSGMRLITQEQDIVVAQDETISAMEGYVSGAAEAFAKHDRWLEAGERNEGDPLAVPKPGYLVIYAKRGHGGYQHVGIVESVKELGDDRYELTTVEGNLGSRIRRINYRYDASPKRKYYNMSTVPKDEIVRENCQYKLQNEEWFVQGFCRTW